MLHLVFQSPLQTATLQRIGAGDAVLFLESACLYLLKNGLPSPVLQNLLLTHSLFVLISDIETRGIAKEELFDGIQVINHAAWVDLTVEYQVIQSWF